MTNNLSTTEHQISTLIDEFLDEATSKPAAGHGSLVFAVDATGSREDTWDIAVDLQAKMFREVGSIGGLDIQMMYFRGTDHVAECRASGWMNSVAPLTAFMAGIKCRYGLTQIAKVLDHVLRESSNRKIGALVYVGDFCEESRECLVPLARRLADQGVPIFIFQEGLDPEAEAIFRELTRITKGALNRFDQSSVKQLSELLKAVALFATGGVAALEAQGSAAARLLLGQIR